MLLASPMQSEAVTALLCCRCPTCWHLPQELLVRSSIVHAYRRSALAGVLLKLLLDASFSHCRHLGR